MLRTYNRILDIIQKRVFAGTWVMPNPCECILYLIQELGELSDAHMRCTVEHVRRRDREEASPMEEVGDVLLMTLLYIHSSGLDVEEVVDELCRKLVDVHNVKLDDK